MMTLPTGREILKSSHPYSLDGQQQRLSVPIKISSLLSIVAKILFCGTSKGIGSTTCTRKSLDLASTVQQMYQMEAQPFGAWCSVQLLTRPCWLRLTPMETPLCTIHFLAWLEVF